MLVLVLVLVLAKRVAGTSLVLVLVRPSDVRWWRLRFFPRTGVAGRALDQRPMTIAAAFTFIGSRTAQGSKCTTHTPKRGQADKCQFVSDISQTMIIQMFEPPCPRAPAELDCSLLDL